MSAQWTGEVVGQLHQYGISQKALAESLGWNPKYLSQVLNCRVNPKRAEEKVRSALAGLIPQKPPEPNPVLELVTERKEMLVACRDDIARVAGTLDGSWIVTGVEQVNEKFLFYLGKVCSSVTES